MCCYLRAYTWPPPRKHVELQFHLTLMITDSDNRGAECTAGFPRNLFHIGCVQSAGYPIMQSLAGHSGGNCTAWRLCWLSSSDMLTYIRYYVIWSDTMERPLALLKQQPGMKHHSWREMKTWWNGAVQIETYGQGFSSQWHHSYYDIIDDMMTTTKTTAATTTTMMINWWSRDLLTSWSMFLF